MELPYPTLKKCIKRYPRYFLWTTEVETNTLNARYSIVSSQRERSASIVRAGDRERLQEHQAIHGGDDIEEFRTAVLLLRVRVSAVLDLASSRSTRTGGTDRRVRAFAHCDSRQYAYPVEEGNRNRVEKHSF